LDKPKAYVELNRKKGEEAKKRYEAEIKKNTGKIASFDKFESEQYMRYREGGITQEEYVKTKLEGLEKRELLAKQSEEFEISIKNLKTVVEKQNKAIRALVALKDESCFTKEIINSLIKNIYIYPGKLVEIEYSFTNEMADWR